VERERRVIKRMEIKGHKIKILKDSQGIPLKIFLDDKEVIGVDKIEIKSEKRFKKYH
jgi:hypothetical protein